MIELTNVTYRYPQQDQPALSHLSLSIKAGEAVCVMGANGSGKSTFALLLAGLIEPQGGRLDIRVDNESPLPVGILFQNPDNQMVAVTVEKEVAFALENLGTPPDEMERRIAETLERFRITHLRRRLTSELSGGEKQRVALASVMVMQPPILVLDEPDSFLDEAGKTLLTDELARIKASTPVLTEIRITQYPHVARSYERLILFDQGAVAADGRPADIFADTDLCLRTGLRYRLDAAQGSQSGMPDLSAPDGSPEQIVTRQLGFTYGNGREILRELSLVLEGGQTLGVVGPSGSGKSTLGLLLCRLLMPTSGEVELLGLGGQSLPPENTRGRVSGLFQQPERQFFLPTCAEEISFGPGNLGHKLTSGEIAAMFSLIGLDSDRFGGRDPFTLSGGEKRRLAFAAVLSMGPRFIVFDEPTCGLDQDGVGRFIRLCRWLKQQRAGVVIITHDGDIIHALADRVLMLSGDGGRQLFDKGWFFENPRLASVVSSLTGNDFGPS